MFFFVFFLETVSFAGFVLRIVFAGVQGIIFQGFSETLYSDSIQRLICIEPLKFLITLRRQMIPDQTRSQKRIFSVRTGGSINNHDDSNFWGRSNIACWKPQGFQERCLIPTGYSCFECSNMKVEKIVMKSENSSLECSVELHFWPIMVQIFSSVAKMFYNFSKLVYFFYHTYVSFYRGTGQWFLKSDLIGII